MVLAILTTHTIEVMVVDIKVDRDIVVQEQVGQPREEAKLLVGQEWCGRE